MALVFTVFSCSIYAQESMPTGYIKKNRLTEDSSVHISSLSRHFLANFTNQDERLQAIYHWVISNIKYSTDSVYHINSYADENAKLHSSLRRKKGVCENFAVIFSALANACGSRSVVIPGYTRQGGYIDRAGHAWVATFKDNNWFLSDPTWDAGKLTPDYYLTDPASFIYSHMPFDPLWQLFEKPVSHKEFIKGGMNIQGNPGERSIVNQKIDQHLKLKELDQLNASEKRMNEEGALNDLIRNEIARTKMDIEVIHEDRDMELYNSAAEDLNKAKKIYNQFVQYRNNEFTPARPVDDISNMLNPVRSFLQTASNKIASLKKSNAKLTLDHSYLEQEIDRLNTKTMEQHAFITVYFQSRNTVKKQ